MQRDPSSTGILGGVRGERDPTEPACTRTSPRRAARRPARKRLFVEAWTPRVLAGGNWSLVGPWFLNWDTQGWSIGGFSPSGRPTSTARPDPNAGSAAATIDCGSS